MTPSTPASRSAIRSDPGTANGMPESRTLRCARTSRWPSVVSGSRNARAISPVVSPPTVRSVSATCASSDSAGWQQANSSSSCASGIAGASDGSGAASAASASTAAGSSSA